MNDILRILIIVIIAFVVLSLADKWLEKSIKPINNNNGQIKKYHILIKDDEE